MIKIALFTSLISAFSINTIAAEVSGSVSFTNDYRFRGISQTAGDAAVQGSLDVSFENGVYAGVWGSNVDFGDEANLEVDYYVGYAGSITEELVYDATLFYFQYPGYGAADIDFFEVDFGLHYKDISLLYNVSNDYLNSSESAHNVALDYSLAITEDINLDLHAGYSFGDYWDGIRDFNDYQDYSIGLSSSFAGIDVSIAYLMNTMDTKAEEISHGEFSNDDTVLFTVSRTF
ncbi:TorF family putative porin [Colwellia psychrerythraea]|uniref:TIGR02001 family outer membrane protein n=1 Tax=Colwellia psychrerythraea (strain 34H / ATCC BAA-681) TaxID=167879 RepID=Q483J7_COLP3|nr:TorF family putative porin [Colwellia psychrerythraea]AAZ26358.1 hypothetical protein CPS_2041 [Colwellia psychrerythraea 34H]